MASRPAAGRGRDLAGHLAGTRSAQATLEHDDRNDARARTLPTGPIVAVVLALALLVGMLLVRHFAVQVVTVSGESMEPLLEPGDRVVLDKVTLRMRPLERGDVVVVDFDSEVIDAPEHSVKRVIAFQGESVTIHDGAVHIDGVRLEEPYATDETAAPGCQPDNPCVVPEGHIWVMGDNRLESGDSRTLGPVPDDHVAGLVVARIWPPTSVRLL